MSRTPHQDGSAFFEAVQRAIDHGAPLAELSASETFNGAAQHVAVLLADAVDAFRRRSFGTSTFIAITALEEAAKAEVLGFRVRPRLGESKHVRDPMRDHRQKHLIAVRPTTAGYPSSSVLTPVPAYRRKPKSAVWWSCVRGRFMSMLMSGA
jgi:hypothetical protein